VAVAAHGELACGRAVVVRARVAVVAFLAALDDLVAAHGLLARAQAIVVVAVVPVVALLGRRVHEAVTALGDFAFGEAIVGFVGVAVVALLAGLNETVTAPRPTTGSRAIVRVVVVPVVALLAGIGLAVTARDRRTLASRTATLALGGIDIQEIRAAHGARVLFAELLARSAPDALLGDGSALGPALVADLGFEARFLDDPLPVFADPELARAGAREGSLAAFGLGLLGIAVGARGTARFGAGTGGTARLGTRSAESVPVVAPVAGRSAGFCRSSSGPAVAARASGGSGRSTARPAALFSGVRARARGVSEIVLVSDL